MSFARKDCSLLLSLKQIMSLNIPNDRYIIAESEQKKKKKERFEEKKNSILTINVYICYYFTSTVRLLYVFVCLQKLLACKSSTINDLTNANKLKL